MNNSTEELAYWYLRLNGFFPLKNLVIHKSSNIKYTSDCDVLAIRPPDVYEEIGGQDEDWDPIIIERGIDFSRFTGVICEVKSGGFSVSKIFKKNNLQYALGRTGFVKRDEIKAVADSLFLSHSINLSENMQIAKILFSNEYVNSNSFVSITLNEAREFIRKRVQQYPVEKFRDRMFFDSVLVQEYIDIHGRDLHGMTR